MPSRIDSVAFRLAIPHSQWPDRPGFQPGSLLPSAFQDRGALVKIINLLNIVYHILISLSSKNKKTTQQVTTVSLSKLKHKKIKYMLDCEILLNCYIIEKTEWA